ncbi:hypothetical protein [Pararobbsia alpina]|uniref:Uncharacterized protein n=1 Tax=Pararobbsia alpina TaxID=621374 RepID=A0A6S7C2L6_9BURK|nr:hypothetical protein [Pararobbsia alpina]CAB3799909.1 hypothetical protein LMG28138_04760 [Pararobbsia alpina]
MNSLKLLLVSFSFSLCAAVAQAQDSSAQPAPATNTTNAPQDAQGKNAQCKGFFSSFFHQFNTSSSRPADSCVGPASFCNIYFGG